jgi:hypothetical protein
MLIYYCIVLFYTFLQSYSVKYKIYDPSSIQFWSPSRINPICPVFVVAQIGLSGFGDKLEHYVYSLNIAKLFQATLILDAKSFINTDPHTRHSGTSDYFKIAKEILGINFYHNITFLTSNYPNLKSRSFNFTFAHKNSEYIFNSKGKNIAPVDIECNTVIYSDVNSCELWCPLHVLPPFNFLENVKWLLHRYIILFSFLKSIYY